MKQFDLKFIALDTELKNVKETVFAETLEEAIGFINDDELVEVTPHSIRLRKFYLKENERKRAYRNKNINFK